jgi:hypothetical protein
LVNVRAPEQDELQDDITHFVASGLVLETNQMHGRVVLPVPVASTVPFREMF